MLIKNTTIDTARLELLIVISDECEVKDILQYAVSANTLADSIIRSKGGRKSYTVMRHKASALSNIGYYYKYYGDLNKALEHYIASIKICEESDDKDGQARNLNNMGIIYESQGDTKKALESYMKCLSIKEKLSDKRGIGMVLNNIGLIYSNKKDNPNALLYLGKCLIVSEELGDKRGAAMSLNNIGQVYEEFNEYNKAFEYYYRSLNLQKEINDLRGMSTSYYNIGMLNLKQGKIADAMKNASISYKISKDLKYPSVIEKSAMLMKNIYLRQGDFKNAFSMYTEEMHMKDSVLNKENFKRIQKLQARYEYEKKSAADSTAFANTLTMKNLEVGRQRLVLTIVAAGFVLLLVFFIIIYRTLKFTRKQKNIIEEHRKNLEDANQQLHLRNEEIETQRDEIRTQRDLVVLQKTKIEEIHSELTESIEYAKRIQKAVLSSESFLVDILKNASDGKSHAEYFVFFKPREIVSGDFYFFERRRNQLMIAVADCTGHGVPGAFMSMLAISFLNTIVADEKIQTASSVLDELRSYIISSLQQRGMENEQKDGMDIIFIALDIETNKAQIAAANNPLWIYSANSGELTDIVPDKMPVAIYENMKPFTNHVVQLNMGDILYVATDGFEDQFGGPRGKKFMYKNLKNLLKENALLEMSAQKEILASTFDNWKNGYGEAYEQTDDVTIVGFKIGQA